MENEIRDENTLYVGNIYDEKPEFLKREIQALFSNYGRLARTTVFNPNHKKGKAYAFVCFSAREDAEKAKRALQYYEFHGLPLRILFKDEEKHFKEYSNVLVENIPDAMDLRGIHVYFERYGEVACVTKNGKKAFVQYYDPDNACQAMKELNGRVEAGNKLILSLKDGRPPSSKNIYFKNLPKNPDQKKLVDEVTQLFSKYGKISSIIVDKYHGFVSYDEVVHASSAIDDLTQNKITLDGAEEPLYVNWSQAKGAKDNALFLKDLKLQITEEDLKHAFETFGKVSSVSIKEKFDGKKVVCKLATIVFNSESDMKNALNNARDLNFIKQFFIHSPFIVLHETKDEREKNSNIKQQLKSKYEPNKRSLNATAQAFSPSEEVKDDKQINKNFIKDYDQIIKESKPKEVEFAKLVDDESHDDVIERFREKLLRVCYSQFGEDTIAHRATDKVINKLRPERMKELINLDSPTLKKITVEIMLE